MNQLGDEGGRRYNRRPYEDYTGYKPVNTAFNLWNPSRWQPLLTTPGNGTFTVQQFVTPQWGLTRPYWYAHPRRFRVPNPRAAITISSAYKAQADEVIAVQASLTDYQKMVAELFDNKISGLGFSALFIALSRGLSLDEFVHYDFLTNVAAFDGGIATWKEKVRHDAVRPVSAIRHLYRNRRITGWAGPGRGVVDDLPGVEWRSYLNTGNHPEYPSGSSCFCAAHAQASRRYLESDSFGWSVQVPAGSSVIEPGVTPGNRPHARSRGTRSPNSKTIAAEAACGAASTSSAATTEGQEMCRPIGDLAFEFVQRHMQGTAK